MKTKYYLIGKEEIQKLVEGSLQNSKTGCCKERYLLSPSIVLHLPFQWQEEWSSWSKSKRRALGQRSVSGTRGRGRTKREGKIAE